MPHDDVIASSSEQSPEAIRQGQLLKNYMMRERHPEDLVKRIYKYVDKWLLIEGIAAKSPCKASCSACCTMPVDISKSEAYVISKNYGIDPVNFKQERHLDLTKYEKGNCPFLLDNKCQIYPLRPLVCRIYHSLDPVSTMCGTKEKGLQFNIRSMPGFMELLKMLVMGNPSIEGGGDIRYFFGEEQIIIKDKK